MPQLVISIKERASNSAAYHGLIYAESAHIYSRALRGPAAGRPGLGKSAPLIFTPLLGSSRPDYIISAEILSR